MKGADQEDEEVYLPDVVVVAVLEVFMLSMCATAAGGRVPEEPMCHELDGGVTYSSACMQVAPVRDEQLVALPQKCAVGKTSASN